MRGDSVCGRVDLALVKPPTHAEPEASLITYSSAEIVFAGAFFVVAAIVSHSIASRTRSLVLQVADHHQGRARSAITAAFAPT